MCDKRDKAITCVLCRDAHLTYNVFWYLQTHLFKGKWSLMQSYFKQNYCHACLLSSPVLLSTFTMNLRKMQRKLRRELTIFLHPCPCFHKIENEITLRERKTPFWRLTAVDIGIRELLRSQAFPKSEGIQRSHKGKSLVHRVLCSLPSFRCINKRVTAKVSTLSEQP